VETIFHAPFIWIKAWKLKLCHHEKQVFLLFDFPDEIITRIISYLPTHDIVRTISLVSERMNHLSKDSSVGISVNSKTLNFVLAIPERTRQITHLKLYNSILSTLQIVDMKNLKTIKMVYSTTAKFTQQFIEALPQLKNLENVHLSGEFEKSSFVKVGALKHLV
jgi:hypothetical protein